MACLYACVLTYFGVLTWLRACILACLACLHAWSIYVHLCLVCSRAYMFTCASLFCVLMCSQALHACCARISYMLTCLRASLTSFVLFSLHLKSWLPKILIYKNLFLFKEVFRTHLNIYEGVFCEKKLNPKSLSLFSQKD